MNMRARFVVAALLMLSCDARDFWRGKAPEQVDVTNPPAPACKASSDCVQDMNKPLCVNGMCVACNVFDDATANKGCQERTGVSGSRACIRSTGRCGECNDTVLCAQGDTFACRDGACVDTCDAHEQCTSKVCDVYRNDGAGQCLARSDVLYVDNNKACGGDGTTPEKAECDLEKGLTKLGGRKAIRVMPSTKLYLPPMAALNNVSVALYGPASKDDASKAKVQGPILITGTSQVIVDGFDVIGGSGGVSCKGDLGSRAEVRRSQIQGVSGPAILVEKCTAIIDRSRILKNTGMALRLFESTGYRVTNNFIVGNSAGANSVVEIETSMGDFAFNTLAMNISNVAAGGIRCFSQAAIEDSIFFQNMSAGGGSQISGVCTLVESVLDTKDPRMNVADQALLRADPDFEKESQDDYHLKNTANNRTCCIDQATVKASVKFDFDGRRRPVGMKADRGAHEVPSS